MVRGMVKQNRLSSIFWSIAVGVNGALLIFFLNALRLEGFFKRPVFLSAQNDPPLGTELPFALRSCLDSRKPLLLVAFGQCSECTVKDLNGWAVMLERWASEVKGIIVAKESEKALRELREKNGWKVPVIADEQGKILQRLNAYFLPRAYGFSPEGKLVWKQDSLAVTQLEAIRAVVEAVKGKEYARRVFDRKPAWAEALGKGAKGQDQNPALNWGGEQ